nr:hemocyanin D chain-like [Penaeus vannamei]
MSVDVTDKSTARAYYSRPLTEQLYTYFRIRSFEASKGIDFKLNPEEHFKVHFQSDYLQHTPFCYTIKVFNRNGEVFRPKVRIFLAPKFDSVGRRFNLARSVTLQDSSESSIFSLDTQDVYFAPQKNEIYGAVDGRTSGCSWPENLQLPRGKPDGMNFLLFVMVTDASLDTPLSQMHGCTDPGNYYLSPGSCIAPLLSRTSPMQFLRPPQWQVPRPVAHGISSGQEEWPRDDRSLRGRILEHETTGTRHYVR